VKLYTGTSGFSYKEWKGSFYPEDLPESKMLAFFAERLPSVEINNTFYRMPKPELLEKWAGEVPESFRFVLKASQRITHMRRLKAESEPDVKYFFEVASALGDKLGPCLFQLPPNMKKDAERLDKFLGFIPEGKRIALEFRHETWLDDEVQNMLKGRSTALCVSEADEEEDGKNLPLAPLVASASYGYFRLRKKEYTDDSLKAWIAKIRTQPWSEVYVFFKHEDEGTGPKLAAKFRALFEATQ
jgi:uncharacterized protein YecE (DUF72 family)